MNSPPTRHPYSRQNLSLNSANERVWLIFRFKTEQGIHCLTDEEAAAIVVHDRDSEQRDLFYAIERGDYLQFRIFSYPDAHRYRLGSSNYQTLPLG